MRKLLNNILVYLTIGIFLLSTTGISIFVHTCSTSNNRSVYLYNSYNSHETDCCKKHIHENDSECCSCHFQEEKICTNTLIPEDGEIKCCNNLVEYFKIPFNYTQSQNEVSFENFELAKDLHFNILACAYLDCHSNTDIQTDASPPPEFITSYTQPQITQICSFLL